MMEITERIKSLPEGAVLGFKYQEDNGNWKWGGESDGYKVADLLPIIEDAEKWRAMKPREIDIPCLHGCGTYLGMNSVNYCVICKEPVFPSLNEPILPHDNS